MRNVITGITIENAIQAIEAYIEMFDATLLGNVVYMKDMPEGDTPKYEGLVAHAEIKIGETSLFINDQLHDHYQQPGKNIQFVLNVESMDELELMTERVRKHASIIRPIEEEYWGAHSFSIEDDFGVIWHIYYIHEPENQEA